MMKKQGQDRLLEILDEHFISIKASIKANNFNESLAEMEGVLVKILVGSALNLDIPERRDFIVGALQLIQKSAFDLLVETEEVSGEVKWS